MEGEQQTVRGSGMIFPRHSPDSHQRANKKIGEIDVIGMLLIQVCHVFCHLCLFLLQDDIEVFFSDEVHSL